MCKVWMAWKKSIKNSQVYGIRFLKIILIMQLLWVKGDGLFIGKHEVQFYDGCAALKITSSGLILIMVCD